MSKKYTIAVIGATGSVGSQVVKCLDERSFPIKEIIVAASENSTGKEISFGDSTIKVQQIDELNFSKIDIAFFCAGENIAKKYAKSASDKGCIVIDKSTCYRMDKNVPLIVPEANINALPKDKQTIISNPNCCTIPLAVALKPLDNAAKIKRVIVSTYQSVSGVGKAGMDELYQQTKAKFIFENIEPKAFPNQIAFNLFPHIGDFREDAYTDEEHKIAQELQKIMGEHVRSTVTCVRVPVFVSHSMSVNVEFENELDAKEAEEILDEADGVVVFHLENELKYATPVEVVENDEVYVSRIRNDVTSPNCLNMWICTDNLRKGAALNAVQIAEEIINQG